MACKTSISAVMFLPTLSFKVLNPSLQYFEANSEASAGETAGIYHVRISRINP